MAQKASKESVAADMQPPNFRWVVQHIRGEFQKKKDKIASINGELSEFWDRVAGHKVSKRAGKIFAALDKLDHKDRLDTMRDLNGLINAAGWAEQEADLVDGAQGNVVQMRVGTNPTPDGDEDLDEALGNEEQGDDLDEALKDESGKAADQDAERAAKIRSIDAARAHLQTTDQPQPFTGDNSDLAGETVQ